MFTMPVVVKPLIDLIPVGHVIETGPKFYIKICVIFVLQFHFFAKPLIDLNYFWHDD